ncbi:uncharacterized protein LOC127723951 [Mytilus californianus]|uniref:uncharacterized protein LOC127723951 n=1 Tax=Mytilus californianus TaxID=6549 RepID=UPI00224750A5|nr:uncharacterized protein LOC127723951 [Mytilus californianus]
MRGHLCPDWTGRLGNIMFQYASLFGIAKRNDMVLAIHEDDEITSVFDNLAKFKHVLFLAYTAYYWKDLLWREKYVVGSDVVRMRPVSPEVDMCVLSKCNHSIMTVGSFGWWAAWLANGTAIYYKNVAKHNSSFRNDFSADMTDYFYPGWIGF